MDSATRRDWAVLLDSTRPGAQPILDPCQRSASRLGLAAIALAGLAGPGAGQLALQPLFAMEGNTPTGAFGFSVSEAGDVNADGVPDFVVGDPDGGPSGRGSITVFSGTSGLELWCFDAPGNGEAFGFAVSSAGDVNGDGRDDILVGDPEATVALGQDGEAYIVSGTGSSILLRMVGKDVNGATFGYDVAAAGDVNGDGCPDVIVGDASFPFYHDGYVRVLCGGTGSVIWEFEPPPADIANFGYSVDGGTDIDGDDIPDVIIGNYRGGSQPVPPKAGSVYVFSGASGQEIYNIYGNFVSNRLGQNVGFLSDVDDDGVPDFFSSSGFMNGVKVFSGADGDPIYFATGIHGSEFGTKADNAGDVDGDGVSDLIVSAQAPGITSYVRILCGRTGDVLQHFDGQPGQNLGLSVSGAGDVNSDGKADVLIGAENSAYLYAETTWVDLGKSLAGLFGPPVLTGNGVLTPGHLVTLTLSSAAPLTVAHVVIGLQDWCFPKYGGFVVPSADVIVAGIPTGFGYFELSTTWPPGLPPGFDFFFQVWVADAAGPHGFAASNGLKATTTP